MSRIKVTNTAIIVEDYELGSEEKLERSFKVWDPVTHKNHYVGLYYDKDNRRLYLPAGIDLWFVKRVFQERYYDNISPAIEPEPIDIKMKYRPRDEEQLEALKFACGVADETYYDNLQQMYKQTSINLSTGLGKTFVSIASIGYFKCKSIIITANSSLLDQWANCFVEYTNMDISKIYKINGSSSINMIFNDRSNKAKNAYIYLATHSSLQSYADRNGWDKIGMLFDHLGIGIKIYDEFHQNFDNMMMIDFFTNTWKTFYLSATPGRSQFYENRIFQLAFKNVPAIDLYKEEQNHTEYIALKYNSHPTPLDIQKCKNNVYGLDRMAYVDYITTNKYFYKALNIIMSDFVMKVINKGGKVLMYIGTNQGILRVYQWIADNYRELIGDIGLFTSLVEKSEKRKEQDKRLILTTTKSAGAGEDIKGLKLTVVLAEPFKSEILARQTLGRTRDSNTLYLELVDLGFKKIKSFYFSKLPVFNKYATGTSDTTIDTYELTTRSDNIDRQRNSNLGVKPISLCDTRFGIGVDEEERNTPICPISFIDEPNDNVFTKR